MREVGRALRSLGRGSGFTVTTMHEGLARYNVFWTQARQGLPVDWMRG